MAIVFAVWMRFKLGVLMMRCAACLQTSVFHWGFGQELLLLMDRSTDISIWTLLGIRVVGLSMFSIKMRVLVNVEF